MDGSAWWSVWVCLLITSLLLNSILCLLPWLACISSSSSKLFLFFKTEFRSFPQKPLICFSPSWFSSLVDWGPETWSQPARITVKIRTPVSQFSELCALHGTTWPAEQGKVLSKKRFLSQNIIPRVLSLFNLFYYGHLFLHKRCLTVCSKIRGQGFCPEETFQIRGERRRVSQPPLSTLYPHTSYLSCARPLSGLHITHAAFYSGREALPLPETLLPCLARFCLANSVIITSSERPDGSLRLG